MCHCLAASSYMGSSCDRYDDDFSYDDQDDRDHNGGDDNCVEEYFNGNHDDIEGNAYTIGDDDE